MGKREIHRDMRRVMRAAVMARLAAPIVRNAMSDRKVRAAAGDAVASGRRLLVDVNGSEPREIASRMARDERLQGEVTSLVRSFANAVDVGIERGRRAQRRRRRRQTLLLATGALAAVGIAYRRKLADLRGRAGRKPDSPEEAPSTPQTEWIAS